MKFEEIRSHLKDIPYMTPEKGKTLYEFILDTKPTEFLELGFCHGTSSCYIAAALDEIGKGHLTTVDLLSSIKLKPSIEDLLVKTGLQKNVTVVRERTTYNWFLKKKIEECSTSNFCKPIYDFCFIDGSKDWTTTSCTFFLVDKLLKEGGWLLFDDYNWKFTKSDGSIAKHAAGWNPNMGTDELEQSHITLIFHLLVMQHPDYSLFKIQDDDWAWAKKIREHRKLVKIETKTSLQAKLIKTVKNIVRKEKLNRAN